MTETTVDASAKKPGVVIFVAILNFITSFFIFLVALFCLVVLIFGNIMGVYEFVTKQITQVYSQPNLSLGLNFIFGLVLVVSVCLAVCYLILGLSLLKGRKLAWYFQIALLILGLLGFPIGTILNAILLILFFQPAIRNYFNV